MTMISRIARILISLLALAAVLYVLACVLLLVFQRSLIYFPQPRSMSSPSTVLELSQPDAKVLVSVWPRASPNALIYFGGNAEDVSQNLLPFSQAFPDQALYLLHYRSFGGSTGSPSEESINRDALALFDKVHAVHPHVAIVGRSLGTGVAIRLASERPASRLILITPYNSLVQLAQSRMPLFPVKWVMRDTFESWRYAPLITVPTLLIAAGQDEIIPRASTEQLHTHFAKGVATLQVIPGKDHNSISDSPQYLQMLRDGL
ncbi:alpha/beta hydrolase [Pseudomonas sp. UMAB-08]|uniref:alpha/beta hydrolase n=1 Tax=Pseudomonas sp. UMAB-08 TaxID=1365375 RepID=UPI001C581517|nr:alpha/beta hydrolase [Pseudomonas sp. UMAB-08]